MGHLCCIIQSNVCPSSKALCPNNISQTRSFASSSWTMLRQSLSYCTYWLLSSSKHSSCIRCHSKPFWESSSWTAALKRGRGRRASPWHSSRCPTPYKAVDASMWEECTLPIVLLWLQQTRRTKQSFPFWVHLIFENLAPAICILLVAEIVQPWDRFILTAVNNLPSSRYALRVWKAGASGVAFPWLSSKVAVIGICPGCAPCIVWFGEYCCTRGVWLYARFAKDCHNKLFTWWMQIVCRLFSLVWWWPVGVEMAMSYDLVLDYQKDWPHNCMAYWPDVDNNLYWAIGHFLSLFGSWSVYQDARDEQAQSSAFVLDAWQEYTQAADMQGPANFDSRTLRIGRFNQRCSLFSIWSYQSILEHNQ